MVGPRNSSINSIFEKEVKLQIQIKQRKQALLKSKNDNSCGVATFQILEKQWSRPFTVIYVIIYVTQNVVIKV